jgi:hypothetical protein
MSKPSPTLARAAIRISTAGVYQEPFPTQAWLAEAVRTVASRLYGQVGMEASEENSSAPFAVHRTAITGQVSKTFGALLDEGAPHLSVSWVLELLLQIEDLAHIGQGYYIPRESRVVRLAHGWGRIAGGLPLDSSEHPDKGIKSVQRGTIGRLVRLAENFSPHDHGTEYSEVFEWMTRNADQIFSDLCERLPERSASRPPADATVYYNAQYQRARTRRDRWQNKFPEGAFVVARIGSLPTHYYVHISKGEHSGMSWFEVTKEEARKWVLLAETVAGTTNPFRVDGNGKSVGLFLPDMLPAAWTAALFACSSTVIPGDKGWTLEIKPEARGLLEILLRGANIQPI